MTVLYAPVTFRAPLLSMRIEPLLDIADVELNWRLPNDHAAGVDVRAGEKQRAVKASNQQR